jgi:hypothetical protein
MIETSFLTLAQFHTFLKKALCSICQQVTREKCAKKRAKKCVMPHSKKTGCLLDKAPPL